MPERLPRMTFRAEYAPSGFGLIVRYMPMNVDGDVLNEWGGHWKSEDIHLSTTLKQQLDILFGLMSDLLPVRTIPFPNGISIGAGKPALPCMTLNTNAEDGPALQLFVGSLNQQFAARAVQVSRLSVDGQRLLSDVLVSLEAESWKHLQERLHMDQPPQAQIGVFISYRARPDIKQFAEAVAIRLEREGLHPFFDQWDILAGDSLVGKIDAAFASSGACIIILSKDYHQGQWATQEMRTALTKRVTQGYRVIPAKFEECDVPQLLNDAKYVDFRGHDEDNFEIQMREVIQAIFGLTRRPYLKS
jgi:hypothetical protein